MRFHTDTLEPADIYRMTADLPGVYADTNTRHGSRSRDHALEVKLIGNSNNRPNAGHGSSSGNPDDRAATWDEWGIVIARMFDADPEMTCRAYDGADDFHYRTAERFRTLEHADQHKRHRWEYAGIPRTFYCTAGCGAEQRN